MRANYFKYVSCIAGAAIFLLFVSGLCPCLAQPREARRFDSFGNIIADSQQARLDNFAKELSSQNGMRGEIVGYRPSSWSRGSFLRLLHGFRKYLIESRAIIPERIRVAEGEPKNEMVVELWLIPGDVLSSVWRPPKISTRPVLFDQIYSPEIGECVGEFTLDLYSLKDGMRLFSEALREDPPAKAWIVIHPRRRDTRANIASLTERSKALLIRSYKIDPTRILTAIGKTRSHSCTIVNLWLAPGSSVRADEASYYANLMQQAESEEYTVRRVEFFGNEHIRDNTLRREFMQNEGDVFSTKLLLQSLANFNRQGLVYPVTLDDVELRLEGEEKLVDLVIFFRERPHVRRSSGFR